MGVENPRVGVRWGRRWILFMVLLFNILCFCCCGALGENVSLLSKSPIRFHVNFGSGKGSFHANGLGLRRFGAAGDDVLLSCENDDGLVLENGGNLCSVELSAGGYCLQWPGSMGLFCLLLCCLVEE